MKRYKLYIFDWHGTLMRPSFGTSAMDIPIDALLFTRTLDVLHYLKQQGCYLAIATTMPSATIQQYLTIPELMGVFDSYRSADQTANKPHPLMIEEILQELNMDADDAVMIGDSVGDICLAKNADVDMIAAAYGTHTALVLKAYNPRYVINSIEELIAKI